MTLGLRRRIERLERVANVKAPPARVAGHPYHILREWDFDTTEDFEAAVAGIETPDDWRKEFDPPSLIILRIPQKRLAEARKSHAMGFYDVKAPPEVKRTVVHHLGENLITTESEEEWEEILKTG